MHIYHGYMTSVRMRKTLIAALYWKISKLSMKSLTETNSGKLITIVSGDIQAIERPMAMVALLLAVPFVNLMVWVIIGLTSGWGYSAIVAGLWLVILFLQHQASGLARTLKGKESRINDDR